MSAITAISAGAATIVDKLMRIAFDRARTPRSEVYKAGTRALLVSRVSLTNLTCPYQPGTVEFDAFFSGVDEGHAIWRNQQREACQ